MNLLRAILEYDVNEVKVLLHNGADMNARGYNGNSALMLAAEHGYADITIILLVYGANICAKNNRGDTALMVAAANGRTVIVNILLKHGASILEINNYGNTALILAATHGHAEIVSTLLERGFNVDARSYSGVNSLMSADYQGYNEIVEMLLNHGADVHMQNDAGDNALILASISGNTEIVGALLDRGASTNTRNNQGNSAILNAAIHAHIEVVTILSNHGADVNIQNNRGNTALMAAAIHGHTEIIKEMLAVGIDVDMQNSYGNTALMAAAYNGNVEIITILLDYGAKIDEQNNWGNNALMAAIFPGHAEVVSTLLIYGAKIDMQNHCGSSGLILSSIHGDNVIASILLAHRADTNLVDNDGNSALIAAAIHGHAEIISTLLDNGATVGEKCLQADYIDPEYQTAMLSLLEKQYVKTQNKLLAHNKMSLSEIEQIKDLTRILAQRNFAVDDKVKKYFEYEESAKLKFAQLCLGKITHNSNIPEDVAREFKDFLGDDNLLSCFRKIANKDYIENTYEYLLDPFYQHLGVATANITEFSREINEIKKNNPGIAYATQLQLLSNILGKNIQTLSINNAHNYLISPNNKGHKAKETIYLLSKDNENIEEDDVIIARENLTEIGVIGDGNCFYRSLSFLLEQNEDNYASYRARAISYLTDNPDALRRVGYRHDGIAEYLECNSADKAWVDDEVIISAAAYAHNINIRILSHGVPQEFGPGASARMSITLSLRHSHYNPLLQVEDSCNFISTDSTPSSVANEYVELNTDVPLEISVTGGYEERTMNIDNSFDFIAPVLSIQYSDNSIFPM